MASLVLFYFVFFSNRQGGEQDRKLTQIECAFCFCPFHSRGQGFESQQYILFFSLFFLSISLLLFSFFFKSTFFSFCSESNPLLYSNWHLRSQLPKRSFCLSFSCLCKYKDCEEKMRFNFQKPAFYTSQENPTHESQGL